MDIYKKAQSLGVLTEYIDGQGRQRVTEAAALEVILGALPPSAPRRLLDGPVVVRTGLPPSCVLSETAALPVAWKILAGAAGRPGRLASTFARASRTCAASDS